MTPFDDLGLLRAFVGIVECGSLSGAARRLKIPQPTLSRSLRALEEQSGAALLRRSTRGISLTPAGARLLEDARTLLAHAEDASERLRKDQTTLRGHLRLFATIDCGQAVVTRLVSRFLQSHPGVSAELGLANRSLHMIAEGCDVGFLPGKIADESVVAVPAGMIRLCLAASPELIAGRPALKSPADLEAWPWVALAGAQFWSAKQIELFAGTRAGQTVRISPVLVSEGVTSVREAVRCGLGVAVLPEWLIREDLLCGRLARVLPQWKARDLPLHVVYAGHRLLPARVRAFVDFAVGYLKKELAAEVAIQPPPAS